MATGRDLSDSFRDMEPPCAATNADITGWHSFDWGFYALRNVGTIRT